MDDGRISVDFDPDDDPEDQVDDGFEGIQFVPGENGWTGDILGQPVVNLTINFGNYTGNDPTLYTGDKGTALPTSIDLPDWDYSNGCEHPNGHGTPERFCIDLRFYDEDSDGTADADDICPSTPDGSVVDDTGCSIEQNCPDSEFKNRGQQQSCILRTAEDFVQNNLISQKDKGQIVSASAKRK